MKFSVISRITILFLFFCMGCGGSETSGVKEVIDGDSFVLADGRQVRLIGIDAPEYATPGADISRDFLENLIAGRKIVMKRDSRDRDKYGRLLRYVWVEKCFVNGEMVRKGYAQVLCFEDARRHAKEFLELQARAKSAGTGLWAFGVLYSGDGPADKVISWKEAEDYYGRVVTVEGRVVRTHNSGKTCFLNFDRDWENSFSAVIFSRNYGRFQAPPETLYNGKNVKVTGKMKEYKGVPEIVVDFPDQISIVN